MAYTLPTTGTDPKYTTKQFLEALIESAISTISATSISGFVYAEDTTDGLAKTIDGEGFFTASELRLIFWGNDAGTAVQLSEIGTPLTQIQVDELQSNYASISAAAIQVADDAAQTALDRVATGADVVASAANVASAQAAEDAVLALSVSSGAYTDTTLTAAIAQGVATQTVGDYFTATGDDVEYVNIYKVETGPVASAAIYSYPKAVFLDRVEQSTSKNTAAMEPLQDVPINIGLFDEPYAKRAAVIVFTGQSLAGPIGLSGFKSSAGVNVFMPAGGYNVYTNGISGLKYATGSYFDGTAEYVEEGGGTSPLVGTASVLVGGRYQRVYAVSVAFGGQGILQCMMGGMRGNAQAAITKLCNAARTDGYSPEVMFYNALGEEDGQQSTDPLLYVSRWAKFAQMLQLYAAQSMRRPDYVAPIAITYGTQMYYGDSDRAIKEAMLQCSTFPGVINVGPSYPYSMQTDRVHNSEVGNIHRGEWIGMALRAYSDGNAESYRQLKITDLTLSGTTFKATYSGPIVRDAIAGAGGDLTAQGGLEGFEWIDNGTPITVSALSYDGWTVTGTLATAPTGTTAQQVLRYAEQDAVGTAVGRGNVPGGYTRLAGSGVPSVYGTHTHLAFAIPQSITPRSV